MGESRLLVSTERTWWVQTKAQGHQAQRPRSQMGRLSKEVGMNPTEVNEMCKWKGRPGMDGYMHNTLWDTQCGNEYAFEYMGSSPKDNGFYYCPYCGGDIIQVGAEDDR